MIVHGRFSDFGASVNWIAADIVSIQNGILAEQWDGRSDGGAVDNQAAHVRNYNPAPVITTTLSLIPV